MLCLLSSEFEPLSIFIPEREGDSFQAAFSAQCNALSSVLPVISEFQDTRSRLQHTKVVLVTGLQCACAVMHHDLCLHIYPISNILDQPTLPGQHMVDAGWEMAGGSCLMLERGRGGPLCACMATKLHCRRYTTCFTLILMNLTSPAFAFNC